jgi:glyoxylase-like metal-dependent hydrolase (beta-lactamase superfamily II)
VPEAPLKRWIEQRRASGTGLSGELVSDRDLLPGVEVESDVGTWQVIETPGHAPSHVCLHQPERDLLVSGDHLLGRVSLYYDYGYTPDPAGEFLDSLGVVDNLDVQLVLAGHGRPVRDAKALTEANRRAVQAKLDRIRAALAAAPRTPYDLIPEVVEIELPPAMMVGWGLSEVLVYLNHLERRGEAARVDGAEPERWALAG